MTGDPLRLKRCVWDLVSGADCHEFETTNRELVEKGFTGIGIEWVLLG